jgi:hypothetical protein
MSIIKTLMIFATAGVLAACESGTSTSTSTGRAGGVDAATIRDANLSGKLEAASMSGNAVVYSYYTDVISDGDVLTGADKYCGGPGQAVIQLTRGDKGGRGFNTMAFTCR